jgi:gamma-glutamyl-gamma-aminobutyraldehyde dehydrogenase/4-guanidinobutyraldehyde dehydrogenase/NAD-dependent aldehyde dehydrogenase
MTLAREEVFGPVLSGMTFDAVDEAVEIANDTVHGPAAAVWTSDLSTAIRTSRRLRTGTVGVNSFDGSDISVPFGGYRESGFGRDKSLQALDKHTQLESTWIQL